MILLYFNHIEILQYIFSNTFSYILLLIILTYD